MRALTLLLTVALATTAPVVASAGQAHVSSRETVAAIDPSLVVGRGAQLGIVEQEAENAATNGTILPFDTSAYTLSGEASGRQAVKLAPGQYVAFKLTHRANAITIRYAIPDAPSGGGIDAPLTVGVDENGHGNTYRDGPGAQRVTLTSKYAYLYNQYPFTNDPTADLLHPDWWITECSCVPANTMPTGPESDNNPLLHSTVIRADIRTEARFYPGGTVTWWDKTLPALVILLGFDRDGHPILAISGFPERYVLLTSPNKEAEITGDARAAEFAPVSALGDSHGVWFGDLQGVVWLWIAGQGLTRVAQVSTHSPDGVIIAGPCR